MLKNILVRLLAGLGYSLTRIAPPDTSEERAAIARGKSIIEKISPDFTILNGPFKGMRYPSIEITELSLVPKIVGSYEAQLVPVIRNLSDVKFDHIIDIGSAEGYYAVGLAKMFPDSTVHCYDINESDLNFCRRMAELNGASNLTYHNFCSPGTLTQFEFGERSLIICDCEGYEIELFTPEVVTALAKTEVLIEMHDICNPAISKTLLERFSATHSATILNNYNLDFSHLEGLDALTDAEKAFAILEHRGGLYRNLFMEWVYFSPNR